LLSQLQDANILSIQSQNAVLVQLGFAWGAVGNNLDHRRQSQVTEQFLRVAGLQQTVGLGQVDKRQVRVHIMECGPDIDNIWPHAVTFFGLLALVLRQLLEPYLMGDDAEANLAPEIL